jgi:hypothetical protein
MPITLLVLSNLARAADYTGDGIDDLAVGVPYETDIGGVVYAGGVNVIPGSSTGLTGAGDIFVHQNTPGVPGSNVESDVFGYQIGAGDADGDGTDELFVTGFGDGTGGAVWRIDLASASGALSVASAQRFSQDMAHVEDIAEELDYFGYSIVVADFDADGYDDVAVGVSGETIGRVDSAGAVAYFPGSPTGMTTTGSLFLHENVADVAGTAEFFDHFGSVLGAGDFNGDGYADLAIGTADEDWSGFDEGVVHVMYGGASGPGAVSPDDEMWSAGHAGAAGLSETSNNCGEAIAVGDFDGDGYDDLAIGCPGYSYGSITSAGAVLLVYGSAAGLDDSELWGQDLPGVIGDPGVDDKFGRELSSGDYDGDGYDDLAIGVPNESFGIFIVYEQCGVVQVLMGSATGITDVDDGLLVQDHGSVVEGTQEDFEHWGWSLASGDYDGDGLDDLAVGSPYDADAGETQGGVVNVFYGSATGPAITDNEMLHQDTPGIAESVEAYDLFGISLR